MNIEDLEYYIDKFFDDLHHCIKRNLITNRKLRSTGIDYAHLTSSDLLYNTAELYGQDFRITLYTRWPRNEGEFIGTTSYHFQTDLLSNNWGGITSFFYEPINGTLRITLLSETQDPNFLHQTTKPSVIIFDLNEYKIIYTDWFFNNINFTKLVHEWLEQNNLSTNVLAIEDKELKILFDLQMSQYYENPFN